MPLLDLKTDLKSLKYGQDRPDGGSSGQPYIKTDINTIDRGFNQLRLTKFDEGLIRGGVIGSTNAAVTDTLRIGKFLTDAPKGPLFIVKQVGLQLSNPRLESKQVKADRATTGGGFLTNAVNFVANVAGQIENAVGPTRIYNLGVNTLAQIPINHIGGHVVRHGFLPTQDPSKYYEAVVTANNQNGTNRLEGLATKFQLGDRQTSTVNQNTSTSINSILGLISQVTGVRIPSIKPAQLTIANYIGGPGSVYGIGNTIINRTSFTEDKFKYDTAILNSKNFAGKTRNDKGDSAQVNYTSDLGKGPNAISNYGGIPTGSNSFGQSNDSWDNTLTAVNSANKTNTTPLTIAPGIFNLQIQTPANTTVIGTKTPKYERYRKIIEQKQLRGLGDITIISGSYAGEFGIYGDVGSNNYNNPNGVLPTSTKTPIYQNGYGDVVKINTEGGWSKATRELRVGSGRKDLINLTPLFKGEGGSAKDTIDKLTIPSNPTKNINDLVKFRIQAIDTDNPTNSVWMIFRAYITDMSDDVTATWNDVKYAGRGEKFYIYDGFSRKMSVSFKVAALSYEEMKPMYQKLNYLMSNLMPDYNNNLMRGPLMRMTIGSYIDGQLCKLDSLSYKIPQDSPWEIAINDTELILPHIIEVSLGFTPIGSQTQTENLTPQKSDKISNIAQNYNGANDVAGNYINPLTSSILTIQA
jgi:hypothetical protein